MAPRYSVIIGLVANQTESFTATIGYDFDQMLNETVVPSRLNTNYHVLHTVQATKSQRADPPTNSSLPDKTMEDEPKVATFSVDRLHHSQLREPQLQIRLQLLATPICDYCKGFLWGSSKNRYGFNFGDAQSIISELQFRYHWEIRSCCTIAKSRPNGESYSEYPKHWANLFRHYSGTCTWPDPALPDKSVVRTGQIGNRI